MNRKLFSKLSIGVAASICAMNLVALPADADGFTPTWVESGLDKTISAFRPVAVELSPKQPDKLKQIPDGVTEASMGTFKTGTGASVVNHAILLTMKNGLPASLYLDGNGDGMIAADEIHDLISTTEESADGSTTSTNYSCRVMVQVTADGKRGELEFYFSPKDKRTTVNGVPRVIFYHTCFGVTGEINLGGRTVKAAIADSTGAGQFSNTGGKMNIPICWLDVTDRRKTGEIFLINRPFEVDGKWWMITNLTAAGSFDMVPATKPGVKTVKSDTDLSPGHKAPVFTATMMDGKTVNFPADYKGKVVMLDFWATWCGPCMGEVPNVVSNYAKYHSQGFEILGVTLDKEDATAQINKVMAHKEMTWSQVYSGKFWESPIAVLYGIHAIPHALLVDGDTGIILADNDIRAEKLGPAIEKALAAKKK